MNPLQQLKASVENLNSDNLVRQKEELLSLLESLAAISPIGHGNGDGRHHRLSPREREVMGMILTGRRLKEIAAVLDISVKTVTTHRSRLLRKLGIEDNLGLYRYGVRHGLIAV
ncbi:MAG TPA: LuxR C-terminal-related transcriptional regulator [Thermoanaerobaculia bacterium]|nr:LuxR C-terminal-related transcriptional regulator [Thermoanaerobaculia bacterium]